MYINKRSRHRRLVFHLGPEHSHTGISDRACEVAIATHSSNVKVFDTDDAEFSRYTMTELMDGILPNISNPFVELGKFGFRYRKVCAAFGLTGERLIQPAQTLA